jgi:glycosyltransferase involved in cell wall biosynthesis
MEAMAAGLPVLATRVGGVPELVRDGETGLVIAPGDVAAIRDGLARLLADPALRRKMGEAGRADIEQYSFDRLGAARDALYTAIADRRRRRGRGQRRRPLQSAQAATRSPGRERE